ncbi:gamma-interferon-inducible lysosomal thiol reductase [Hyalella azteca]|uniref:Gamma-interferon-inducible lysosomal thiol reductase n=1 Tax=Hyalella azteca TaxID=294128 RepID=A0A8B7NN48_HYAAZ|nr:gamma-interferon-inducible lysosomal thiol reductase [Hyalella azteca]
MEVRGWLLVSVCASIFLAVAGDSRNHAKVEVTVYFETLCPDSKMFFRSQLLPTYTDLKDILDVNFVPFGKALARPRLREGRVSFEFQCQHGQRECQGNRVMSCAQSVLSKEDQMRLFSCMMAKRDPAAAGRECTQALDMEWDPIERCAGRKLGAVLLYMNGRKTAVLRPKLNFVPTVTINGEYTRDNLQNRLESLKEAVCEAYTGDHPKCVNFV